MTATGKRSSAPRKPRAANTKVDVQSASPSLLATLAGEVKTILVWVGVAGAGIAVIVTGLNAYGQRQVQESALVSRIAATEAQGARISVVEAKAAELSALMPRVQQVETRLTAIGPVRDQQFQGMGDRLRVVEAANSQDAERTADLARHLGNIATRIEDILRRMEGVERRLDRSLYLPPPPPGGSRQDGEVPTRWRQPVLPGT